jgi:hypothetical protein
MVRTSYATNGVPWPWLARVRRGALEWRLSAPQGLGRWYFLEAI